MPVLRTFDLVVHFLNDLFLMNRILPASIALVATFALPQLVAAADPAEAQLTKVEHEWADAYVKRDPSFVKRLTTDNFIFIGPDGNAMNKADYVKDITGDTVPSTVNIGD